MHIKGLAWVIALTVMLSGVAAWPAGAAGEGQTGVSVTGILERVIVLVALEEAAGNQIVAVTIDTLSEGDTKLNTYEFVSAGSYRVSVVGDEDRIKDIDLALKDPSGAIIAEDKDDTNVGVVEFMVSKAGVYEINITSSSMGEPNGFYGIVISRTSALSAPVASGPCGPALMMGWRVGHGPDWSWGEQGSNTNGIIIAEADEDQWVYVQWDNGDKHHYRWGGMGKCDLKVLSPVSAGNLSPGMAVRIRRDAKEIMPKEWTADMDKLLGQVRKVKSVGEGGAYVWHDSKEKESWFLRFGALEYLK